MCKRAVELKTKTMLYGWGDAGDDIFADDIVVAADDDTIVDADDDAVSSSFVPTPATNTTTTTTTATTTAITIATTTSVVEPTLNYGKDGVHCRMM